ncbi:MAG: hypothetical protein V2A57_04615 [Elusimicrobiota bacterium]
MQVIYLKSFTRTFDSLTYQEQLKTTDTIEELLNTLGRKIQPTRGLGIKKIGKNLWEARADIRIRILFTILHDTISFVFAGSHDEIRRYLKI